MIEGEGEHSEAFWEICQKLDSLSGKELVELQGRVSWLRKKTAESKQANHSQGMPTDALHFFEAVSTTFQRRTMISILPLSTLLTNTSTSTVFREACESCSMFVVNFFGNQKASVRQAIYQKLTELALDKIEKDEGDLNLPRCLNLLQYPGNLFENAFPGYVKNGVASWIVKSMQQK